MGIRWPDHSSKSPTGYRGSGMYCTRLTTGLELADPDFDTPGTVDVLLRSDVLGRLWCGRKKVLQETGLVAVDTTGLIHMFVKRLWKGHRRKSAKNPPVELTIDNAVGTHCYIKIMGVKYHYVKTGPKTGQTVVILGGSEGGGRRDLSPPRAIEELSTLMEVIGVTENNPAVVIGFGIGGMLAWYLAHSHGRMINKLVVIGAPHPNLYWQYPPAAFCNRVLHFIQWPNFPEQWLAEGELKDGEGKWASSRACDWTGPLNYVRGAAWYRIRSNHRIESPTLLVGARDSAAQLVTSAQYCISSTLRMVSKPDPTDPELATLVLDFLIAKDRLTEGEPKSLMGRMLGVVGRGRELTAKLVLPPVQGS
ncbi:epoxide hydrolase 4-like isoform X2 [Phthorimaea operculella]|nr:epoxide hydrolase 4-like isoform X2 [Phthorimaea operculella]